MTEIIDKRQAEQKQDIIKQLKKTPIIEYACKRAGIGRSTFYRWRKSDEIFAEKVEESLIAGNQLVNDMAESQLINAIRSQNMTAIIFWLKHHHKAYATKVELSGKIKTDDKLTPEQEELVRKALEMASLNDSGIKTEINGKKQIEPETSK